MAGLIIKSPYIKCGGSKNAGGYLKYIGTRERVEILPDDRPSTRKQEQLITKLVSDFPSLKKLPEYGAYRERVTKYNASQFIAQALENNWEKVSSMDGYMSYIANRPRVEHVGDHGLFGDEDAVDLNSAMEELQNYTGNVWTHIMSLKREDAARLGYDNAAAWRDLIRAHRNDIAQAMNINPNDFRWYAAFHNEGDHPHIHMMAWSADPKQGYLSRDGLRQMKSALTNDIFQMEMLHLYEQKSVSRDELVQEARKAMMDLVQSMSNRLADHPDLENLIMELAEQLPDKGKKSYGYLPKKQKALVNQIVDQLTRLKTVGECYEKWQELRHQVDSYYKDEPMKRVPLSQQKEFRAIKNAVIREAWNIRTGNLSFEDDRKLLEEEAERPLQSVGDIQEIWDSICDEEWSLENRDGAVEYMKENADVYNDPYAQYYMGKLYRDGGIVIPDAELAMKYFARAARRGVNAAQYALGELLLSDDAQVRNYDLGIQWLEYAARCGSSPAAYRLGKERMKQGDTQRAVECFTQAAEQGNPFAQYALGKLYLSGKDGLFDPMLSEYYFRQAAEQGNIYAQYFLDRQEQLNAPSVMLAATKLMAELSSLFRDNSLPQHGQTHMHMDRKRRQELMSKRIALGHKEDDHEEYVPTQNWQQTM